MENSLVEGLLRICKILNRHTLEYLIVGGTAVGLHGYIRLSTNSSGTVAEKYDLDFWYNPTYGNYFKLLDVLKDLGQDVTLFKEESEPNPKRSFFRIENENFTIDFLPELPGLSRFRDSFSVRESLVIDEIEIPYINYQDLLINKQMLARPKDIEDIKQLELRKDRPDEA